MNYATGLLRAETVLHCSKCLGAIASICPRVASTLTFNDTAGEIFTSESIMRTVYFSDGYLKCSDRLLC